MHGYETKQHRDAHIKALAVELDNLRASRKVAKEQLDKVPEDARVERTVREVQISDMESRIEQVQEQLRTFKGESPQRRASKRSSSPGEKR